MKLQKILLVQPKGIASEGFGGLANEVNSAAPAAPKMETDFNPEAKGMTFGTGGSVLSRLTFDLGFKAPFAPISLTTVAALTPPDVQVELWDETTQGLMDDSVVDKGYDLVGVTGFHLHRPRAFKVAQLFRSHGIPVAVGGPGVSSEPNIYRDVFDHLFIGEAEFTWPQFIREFREGRPRKEYRQIEKPELDNQPIPRWDLVPNLANDYLMGAVQTTRGCPFDCEFCDVIHLFGRRSRHRPVDHVLAEVAELERRGVRLVMFSDDNFIGRPSYAKELLEGLIKLNNSFRTPLMFSTSLTMNVAKDDTLLEMLADANFFKLLIGIESANPESLIETNKPQNYKTDLIADIHKIHSYGMAIHGQLIVGFDHDGPEIFEKTFQFVQRSCIPTIIVNVLFALPGTMLWHRLRRDGRVLSTEVPEHFNFRSNITFQQMSRKEVYEGFVKLYQRIYEPENVRARMQGMINQIKRKAKFKRTRVNVRLREVGLNRLRGLARLVLRDRALVPGIFTTMASTRWKCRFFTPKAAALWANVILMREFAQSMGPGIQAIIDYEEKYPPRPLQDHAIVFSTQLRKDYKDMFPSVYQRLSSRLIDKNFLNEALVEVFTAFIDRFHNETDRIGDEKYVQMQEICDRAIARLNEEDPTTTTFPDAPKVRPLSAVTDPEGKKMLMEIRRVKLDDDIIKAVELELRRGAATEGCANHEHDHDSGEQPVQVVPLSMAMAN